ncbi:unnamed protein product, partial [Sphacelaria rigidula]
VVVRGTYLELEVPDTFNSKLLCNLRGISSWRYLYKPGENLRNARRKHCRTTAITRPFERSRTQVYPRTKCSTNPRTGPLAFAFVRTVISRDGCGGTCTRKSA